MTQEQKRSLCLVSIIGTLLATYNEDEKTTLHKKLQVKVQKGIRHEYNKDPKTALSIVENKGDAGVIWRRAVDYFSAKEITIEASSCVLSMVSLDEKNLSKKYYLSKGILEKWAKPSRREDAIELEKQSLIVADYVYKITSELYGLEVVEKVSVLGQLKKMKEVA